MDTITALARQNKYRTKQRHLFWDILIKYSSWKLLSESESIQIKTKQFVLCTYI